MVPQQVWERHWKPETIWDDATIAQHSETLGMGQ